MTQEPPTTIENNESIKKEYKYKYEYEYKYEENNNNNNRHITAQEKHAAKLNCMKSVLHCYEIISNKLKELKEIHLDGRLFVAVELMKQLQILIESTQQQQQQQQQQISINNEDIKEEEEKSIIDLIEEFNNYPLIVDIRNKYNETLQMLDVLKMKEGWHRLSEKGDWVCDYMQPKNTNTYSFRCVGIENVPMFNLVALFYEMDLIRTWLPFCQESTELGQLAMYCKQGYVRISLYWPMNDRECLLYGYGVDDLDNGNILIFFDSRESEDINIPKKQNSRVRVDIHVGGFYLERVSNEQTKVTAVFNCDPKTYVPYKLLNWFLGQFMANFLPKLLGAAKFEKNSPYLERIAEKKDFYDRIKNKILRYNQTNNNDDNNDNNDNNNNNNNSNSDTTNNTN